MQKNYHGKINECEYDIPLIFTDYDNARFKDCSTNFIEIKDNSKPPDDISWIHQEIKDREFSTVRSGKSIPSHSYVCSWHFKEIELKQFKQEQDIFIKIKQEFKDKKIKVTRFLCLDGKNKKIEIEIEKLIMKRKKEYIIELDDLIELKQKNEEITIELEDIEEIEQKFKEYKIELEQLVKHKRKNTEYTIELKELEVLEQKFKEYKNELEVFEQQNEKVALKRVKSKYKENISGTALLKFTKDCDEWEIPISIHVKFSFSGKIPLWKTITPDRMISFYNKNTNSSGDTNSSPNSSIELMVIPAYRHINENKIKKGIEEYESDWSKGLLTKTGIPNVSLRSISLNFIFDELKNIDPKSYDKKMKIAGRGVGKSFGETFWEEILDDYLKEWGEIAGKEKIPFEKVLTSWSLYDANAGMGHFQFSSIDSKTYIIILTNSFLVLFRDQPGERLPKCSFFCGYFEGCLKTLKEKWGNITEIGCTVEEIHCATENDLPLTYFKENEEKKENEIKKEEDLHKDKYKYEDFEFLLFIWDYISVSDGVPPESIGANSSQNDRLLNFLKQIYFIKGLHGINEKTDKNIKIHTEHNSIEFILNEEETKVILSIDKEIRDEFSMKNDDKDNKKKVYGKLPQLKKCYFKVTLDK